MNTLKSQLYTSLHKEIYNCLDTISVLKKIPEFQKAYSLLNSKKRSYNLEEHTIMVCQMFETIFAQNYPLLDFDIATFRLLLCLHDIGKPFSLLDNKKEKQNEYTINMIESQKNMLPFSERNYAIAISLISDDPLGFYIRGKIELGEAAFRINKMSEKVKINEKLFFSLLVIYYQVDAGAYTRQAYIGPSEGFIEKPKLEAIFAKDTNRKLIYSHKLNRLVFSDNIEIKFNKLKDELGINNG